MQEQFLAQHGWQDATRHTMPGDFSSRYYVRLNDAGKKALLMVVPTPSELASFKSMQEALNVSGIRVPAIYVADLANGLALIEDLGDQDFSSQLHDASRVEALYALGMDVLHHLHKAQMPSAQLVQFTPQRFLDQVCLFLENYGAYVLKANFSENAARDFRNAWQAALEKACAMPTALMLRDYHAANIMLLPQETGHRRAAVIDFQDGGIGPIAYDIASFLEDARRDVPAPLRAAMMDRYLAAFPAFEKTLFHSAYHILACQRHMRVLAILSKRMASGIVDPTTDYFKRSWGLLLSHQAEPALQPVYAWLDAHVPSSHRASWKPL